MIKNGATAETVVGEATDSHGVPSVKSTSFTCAHCSAYAQHHWGYAYNLNQKSGSSVQNRTVGMPLIVWALCAQCNQETLLVNGKIIYPAAYTAPLPAADMPAEIIGDYHEARAIVGRSPRGAAALLRLAMQKLCPLLGAAEDDINKMIGELVRNGIVNAMLQQALDSVRVIGNEAVHPGTIDLNDDPAVAHALFGLLNIIVEKAITEPKQIGEIYQSLPASKLAGIAQRDAQKP